MANHFLFLHLGPRVFISGESWSCIADIVAMLTDESNPLDN
ncbi:MAG: hypothetical protein WCO80_01400 [Betaproteobacteria bacterium]